jgi:predicted aspartyl protease
MTQVPLQVYSNSVYVQATVNGQSVLFILDTGDAIGPVFNSLDAQRLGLKQLGVIGVSGAGGATQNYGTQASITLGDKTYDDEPGAIDPYLQGPSLLGLPFFLKESQRLTFDFAAGTLELS